MSMFLGQFEMKFVGVGRVVLPKSLREEINGKKLVLRIEEEVIEGYSRQDWESTFKLEERILDERRLIFSASYSAELDHQGRLVIPATLLELAKLGSEIVIIGVGDHFEIWDKSRWQEKLAKLKEEYENLS
ncbi:MAG: hypothetical protein HYW45_00245 [Candidatus Daviesbacteria bacterium]|nr:MAG: hypothetical protein HYW45_00245 [Candidatus Daviesbacteria bacterium]